MNRSERSGEFTRARSTMVFVKSPVTQAIIVSMAILSFLLASTNTTSADPKKAEKAFRRGQVDFSEGKFRAALTAYQAAYQEEPLAAIQFNIAQCHRNLGEYEKSATAFKIYLDTSDNSTNTKQVIKTLDQLRILAAARRDIRRRDYQGARGHFERALRIEPIAPIHRDLARTFERLGNYDDALVAYRDYLEAQPHAEDEADIRAAIERLENELTPDPLAVEQPVTKQAPVYKKWWFWAGLASVSLATAAVVVLRDGVPGSDLGNIGFDR